MCCCESDENTGVVLVQEEQEEQRDESVASKLNQMFNEFAFLKRYLLANLIKVGLYTGNGNSKTFQDLDV